MGARGPGGRRRGGRQGREWLRLGDHLLPTPSEEELLRRTHQSWREEQDNTPARPDTHLEALLAALPEPWLRGVALSWELEPTLPRPELERGICARLRHPPAQRAWIRRLPGAARRLLEELLAGGGQAPYSHLLLHHGADDATSWFWEEAPPTGALEHLRRAGVVMVGQLPGLPEGGRIAYVPSELREALAAALGESPAPPVPPLSAPADGSGG